MVVLLGLQFVPVDRSNPDVTREIRWDHPDTRALAQRACFDCHSNETAWPWYARVAPLSWRLGGHVEDGRRQLNFSEWDRPNEDLDEVIEMIREGEMPLWDYALVHSDAHLTAEEQERLISGLERTFAADPPIERRRGPRPPEDEAEGASSPSAQSPSAQ